MTFIELTKEYDVGVDKFNKDHQELANIINKLYDAMKGKHTLKYKLLLTQLSVQIVMHFRAEDNMFKKYGYPNSEKHMEEHQQICKKSNMLKKILFSDYDKIDDKMLDTMKNMLITHIKEYDLGYKEFFVKKGIK